MNNPLILSVDCVTDLALDVPMSFAVALNSALAQRVIALHKLVTQNSLWVIEQPFEAGVWSQVELLDENNEPVDDPLNLIMQEPHCDVQSVMLVVRANGFQFQALHEGKPDMLLISDLVKMDALDGVALPVSAPAVLRSKGEASVLEKLAYGKATASVLSGLEGEDEWYPAFERLAASVEEGVDPDLERWSLFEAWSWSDIEDHIHTEAGALLGVIDQALGYAREGIIDAAIDGTLDSDMTQLHMQTMIEIGASLAAEA